MSTFKPARPSLEDCEDVLAQLVRVNTCQPEGNEADAVALIKTMLPDSLSCTTIDHGSNRASLIVRVQGRSAEGGIALVGHMDTVACNDEAQWKHPPHEAYVEGDRLYGRGSADMKGGVAAMILALRQILACMHASSRKPAKPLYFCFTADEESGGMGVKSIVRGGYLDHIDELVIAEPSNGQVGVSEKGALWLRLRVHGVSSHASRPDLGKNAVECAMHFAARLKQGVEGRRRHEPLKENTAAITRFQGGVMTNIIPSDALVEIDIRTAPGTSHEALTRRAQEIWASIEAGCPGVHAELSVLNDRPALESDVGSRFVQDLYRAAERAGIDVGEKRLYFYTDASQIVPSIPVPFVIAGPGDDAMAHRRDEWTSLESVARYAQFYSDYLIGRYIAHD